MSFFGYKRNDGKVGTRNYIGVLSLVSCANDVAWKISQKVNGSALFIHSHGCCEIKTDLEETAKTLISLSCNPNLAGVLLISLGCESLNIEMIANKISEFGKHVEKIIIQKSGGATKAVNKGIELVKKMAGQAALIERTLFDDSEIVLGIKCGASDTTSGLISNPVAGLLCDNIIDKKGTCVFGETTEFIGAEHIFTRRAETKEIGKKIEKIVTRLENRFKATGFDMRGSQPTRGNIEGGLTTIEEKSLGAISKSGSRAINGVCEYGEIVKNKGLYIVDTPGREPEFLTALAAAGANIIVFTTGIGAPQGFPFIPVIKVTGNYNTYKNLKEHIDFYVNINSKNKEIRTASDKLFQKVLKVTSGERTKAEILEYGNFPNIWTMGPVI